ncbi:50S ribosome-binding GTPase [Gracilaria domingensis]|nr:50S ribosome-binding GTPase [Gracilaria domingensis]
MHVIMAGNPGVGKSAILNSLVGSCEFTSGISLGSGRTRVLKTVSRNGVKYSDTPGLADTEMRERAAGEISKAFESGGKIKLIFVVLTVAGRVRTDDLATINIVLKAIEDVGIDTKQKYSIIVNMCGSRLLQMLQDKDNRAKIEIPFEVGRKVSHIGYMPLVSDAQEAENYMLSNDITDKYMSFVNDAPVFKLKSNSGLTVRAEGYKETADSLAKQLEDLYRTLEEVKEKRKDPRFWVKVALKMYDSESDIRVILDLFNEMDNKAPFIMRLKKL